jgi:hypothetical protein
MYVNIPPQHYFHGYTWSNNTFATESRSVEVTENAQHTEQLFIRSKANP